VSDRNCYKELRQPTRGFQYSKREFSSHPQPLPRFRMCRVLSPVPLYTLVIWAHKEEGPHLAVDKKASDMFTMLCLCGSLNFWCWLYGA